MGHGARLGILIIAAGGLAACVHVSAEEIAPNKYAPVPAEAVLVFTGPGELKDRGYQWETVAVLFASGSADYTSNKGMLSRLREEAGKRGANGVLLGEQREPGFGERLFFGSAAQRKSQIVAIRWWETDTTSVPVADSLPLAEPAEEWESVVMQPNLEHLDRILWDVMAAQENYHRDHDRYTTDVRALAVPIPAYLHVTVPRAATTGFTIRVEDENLPGIRCVVFLGPAVSYQEFAGSELGVVSCARQR